VSDEGERVGSVENEASHRPTGHVGRRHAVSDVSTETAESSRTIEIDRPRPITWDTERSSPTVGDVDVFEDREELDHRLDELTMNPVVEVGAVAYS
jgi:hypothetical protein